MKGIIDLNSINVVLYKTACGVNFLLTIAVHMTGGGGKEPDNKNNKNNIDIDNKNIK